MRTVRKGDIGWIAAVWLASFACYAPMLLQRCGMELPELLLDLKYGFVLVPLLTTILFSAGAHRLKENFAGQLKRPSKRELAACAFLALAGLGVTCGYSFAAKTDLLGRTYVSIPAFAFRCGYLFLTALAEEAAWRGYFFRRMAGRMKPMAASVWTGMIWAVWHIPMWSIRNALPWGELPLLIIWTVQTAVVLGMYYFRFRNVLSAALLHMIFNVCFLAPVWCSILLLLAGIIFCRRIWPGDKKCT